MTSSEPSIPRDADALRSDALRSDAHATIPEVSGRFFGGLITQAVARWGAQALSWTSTIVVARKLSSEDYGIVGMALVYLGVAGMLSEFGLGATILAKRELSDEQIDQLHSLSVAVGLACCALSMALAPALAVFYSEPRVTSAVAVMSLSFAFTGFSAVPLARARRALDYRIVSSTELIGAVSTTLVVFILALANLGFWALVIGNAAGAVVVAISIAIRVPWRLRRPRLSQVRESLGYSRHVITGQIAYYGYTSADSLVVGKVLGASPLGIYRFAAFITSLPGEKLVNVVSSVSLAYFGKIGNDPVRMRGFLLLLTEALSILVFPILAGIVLVASDAVPLLFGEKWVHSVAPVRIMAVGAAVQVMAVLFAQVLTATLQARRASHFALAALILLPPAYLLAVHSRFGVLAVAAVWAMAQPLAAAPTLYLVLKTLQLRFREYVAALFPALISCTLMSVAVLGVGSALPDGTGRPIKLAVSIATGVLAYVLVHVILFRERDLRLIRVLRTT